MAKEQYDVTITAPLSLSVRWRFHMSTKDCFFNEAVIVKVHYNKIVFTKPTMAYTGNTHNPKLLKGLYNFQLAGTSGEITVGKYNFDEIDSDEDTKVIYLINPDD